MEKNIYQTPQAKLTSKKDKKVSNNEKIAAILITLIIAIINFIRESKTGGMEAGIGAILGTLFIPFAIVLIFQMWRKFRNSDARWNLLLATQIIVLFGQLYSILTPNY